MTKAELIEAVAKHAGISKKAAGDAVTAVFKTISTSLKAGHRVSVPSFGTFKVTKRAARNGINPQTRKSMQIPAMKVARFTPGKALKDIVR